MKLFCFVIFAVIPLFEAKDFRPDYTFYEELDGWLKVHEVPDEWQEARLTCHLEGAMLASPMDSNFLHTMQLLMRTGFPTAKSVYTGIHSTFAKGLFFSLDGIPRERIPAKWALDEPNNVNCNEDCLILHPNGTLADVECRSIYPYICFKKRTDDMAEMNECGTIDEEYKYSNITGSCYKFHTVGRNWQRAFKTCAAEGGYLAIVNSPEEAEFFKTMHRRKQSQIRTSNRNDQNSFVGFRYWQELGTWVTIHGQSLKEAGYDHWAGGEPNNAKTSQNQYEGEYCGSIDAGCDEVGLNDLWCKFENPFICEKEPVVMESLASEPTTISYIDFRVTEIGNQILI